MKKKDKITQISSGDIIDGRYKILKYLGKGGCGTVLLSEDLWNNNRQRAIKILNDSSIKVAGARFNNEFLLLSKLKNENLVRIFDYGVSQKHGEYLSMEYIEWDTLSVISNHLEYDDKILILYEITKAISFLHDHGIVHYDLSPNNIFVNKSLLGSQSRKEENLIKIGDFGLAKNCNFEAKFESIEGNLIYSAPEIFADQTSDKRSDVFSLAMIAFVLFTNNSPYSQVQDQSLIEQKQNWLPSSDDWKHSELPFEIKSVISKCLNPDLEMRPNDLNSLISALANGIKTRKIPLSYQIQDLPFTGRTGLKRFLGSVMHEVQESEQHAILLQGNQGIGKSRFMTEFSIIRQNEGVKVISITGCNLEALFSYLNYEIIEKGNLSDQIESLSDDNINYMASLISLINKPIVINWFNFEDSSEIERNLVENVLKDKLNVPLFWLLAANDDRDYFKNLSHKHNYYKKGIDFLNRNEFNDMIKSTFPKMYNHKELSNYIRESIEGNFYNLILLINHLIKDRIIFYKSGGWFFNLPNESNPLTSFNRIIERKLRDISHTSKLLLYWLVTVREEWTIKTISSALGIEISVWDSIWSELKDTSLITENNGCLRIKSDYFARILIHSIPKLALQNIHFSAGLWYEEKIRIEKRKRYFENCIKHFCLAGEYVSAAGVLKKCIDNDEIFEKLEIDVELFEEIVTNSGNYFDPEQLFVLRLKLAKSYFLNRSFQKCIDTYNDLLENNSPIQTDNLISIYLGLGSSQNILNKFSNSIYNLSKLLKISDNINDSRLRDKTLSKLVVAYFRQGDIENGRRTLGHFSKSVLKTKPKNENINDYLKLINLLIFDKSYKRVTEVFKVIQDSGISPWSSETSISIYLAVIQCFIKSDEITVAERLLKQIRSLEPLKMSFSQNWKIHYLSSLILLSKGKTDSGLGIFMEIREALEANLPTSELCWVLLDYVKVQYYLGNYSSGMFLIQKIMRISVRANNGLAVFTTLTWIVLFRMMRDKPTEKLMNVIENKLEFEDSIVKDVNALCNLIDIYDLQHRTQRSLLLLEYSKKHLKFQDVNIPKSFFELVEKHLSLSTNNISSSEFDLSIWEGKAKRLKNLFTRSKYYFELLKVVVALKDSKGIDRIFKLSTRYFKKIGAAYFVARSYEIYTSSLFQSGKYEMCYQKYNQTRFKYQSIDLPYGDRIIENHRKEHLMNPKMENDINMHYSQYLRALDLFNEIENTDDLTHDLLRFASESINVRRGLIILKCEKQSRLSRTSRIKIGKEEQYGISNTIVERVFQGSEAIFCNNSLNDSYLSTLETVKVNRIFSVACLPIITQQSIQGVLYLDHGRTPKSFSPADQSFLRFLSKLIGIVILQTQVQDELNDQLKTIRITSDSKEGYDELIGNSKPMQEVYKSLLMIKGNAKISIMILGESGTGKELVARIIHRQSERASKPYHTINCSAIPENLIESELFGHKKGAFTGADQNKIGYFELANGGTIFLDEIDQMSQLMQTKILRFIEEGEFYRVGDPKLKKVNVRIIAAAKPDLPNRIASKEFRPDLFYRLNVVQIKLPLLKDRKSDIRPLAEHFIRKHSVKNKRNVKGIENPAMNLLESYKWPGNVRELENTIQRSLLYSDNKTFLKMDSLPPEVSKVKKISEKNDLSLKDRVKEFESGLLHDCLEENNWNLTATSKYLSTDIQTLRRRIRKFRLKPTD